MNLQIYLKLFEIVKTFLNFINIDQFYLSIKLDHWRRWYVKLSVNVDVKSDATIYEIDW